MKKDSLRKHQQDCDENKKLNCTKCDYKTSKADLLHKHVENCKGKPQPKCAYCKFTAKYKSQIKKHEKTCQAKKRAMILPPNMFFVDELDQFYIQVSLLQIPEKLSSFSSRKLVTIGLKRAQWLQWKDMQNLWGHIILNRLPNLKIHLATYVTEPVPATNYY